MEIRQKGADMLMLEGVLSLKENEREYYHWGSGK